MQGEYVYLTITLLSLLGSTFLVIVVSKKEYWWSTFLQSLFFLGISNFGLALGLLIIWSDTIRGGTLHRADALCNATFFFIEFFGVAAINWHMSFTFDVFLMSIRRFYQGPKLWRHVLVWGYTLTQTLYNMLKTNVYEPMNLAHYCYFVGSKSDHRLWLFVPLMITTILSVLLPIFRLLAYRCGYKWQQRNHERPQERFMNLIPDSPITQGDSWLVEVRLLILQLLFNLLWSLAFLQYLDNYITGIYALDKLILTTLSGAGLWDFMVWVVGTGPLVDRCLCCCDTVSSFQPLPTQDTATTKIRGDTSDDENNGL